MLEKQQKPKFLNLFQISMPVTALVSILHRLSGLLLVLMLPVIVYAFHVSIQNKIQFEALLNYFNSTLFQIILIAIVWIVLHHIFAGIRYLLIDIELGVSLSVAKLSAWFANIAALIVTLLFAIRLLT